MTKASSEAVGQLLGVACARNIPAELQFEAGGGTVVTARVRLLELTQTRVLADRPLYLDAETPIPERTPITVHILIHGARYRFASAIEEGSLLVRLNGRQRVPGIGLRRPTVLTEAQRRSHLRVSLLCYDPITVRLVRAVPELPDACPIDAELIAAWILDLSAGGLAVLADHRVLRQIQPGERFYTTFSLPGVDDEFFMLTSVRHHQVVKSSESVRVGLAFVPWRGQAFALDQRRLSQFITDHERRLLRRRR